MGGFFWFMLCVDLLVPIIIFCAGYTMRAHAERDFAEQQKASAKSDFRTIPLYQKNDTPDNWTYAKGHCGKTWKILGLVLLCVGWLPLFILRHGTPGVFAGVGIIVVVLELAIVILSTIPTVLAVRDKIENEAGK